MGQAEKWGKAGRKQQGHGNSWRCGAGTLAIGCGESSSRMGEGQFGGNLKPAIPRTAHGLWAAQDAAGSGGGGVAGGMEWGSRLGPSGHRGNSAENRDGNHHREQRLAAASPAMSPQGSISACRTAGGGQWRGRSSLPP